MVLLKVLKTKDRSLGNLIGTAFKAHRIVNPRAQFIDIESEYGSRVFVRTDENKNIRFMSVKDKRYRNSGIMEDFFGIGKVLEVSVVSNFYNIKILNDGGYLSFTEKSGDLSKANEFIELIKKDWCGSSVLYNAIDRLVEKTPGIYYHIHEKKSNKSILYNLNDKGRFLEVRINKENTDEKFTQKDFKELEGIYNYYIKRGSGSGIVWNSYMGNDYSIIERDPKRHLQEVKVKNMSKLKEAIIVSDKSKL